MSTTKIAVERLYDIATAQKVTGKRPREKNGEQANGHRIDQEEWRPVPSEPDREASSLGRIRVTPRKAPMPNGGFRTYGGTPTKGQWAKNERRYIYARRGHKTRKVAQLVCEAFNGPKPFEKAVVMHDNENPKNNRPSNLKWGTQKANLNYPGFLAYCKRRTGNNNPYVKGKASRKQHAAQENRRNYPTGINDRCRSGPVPLGDKSPIVPDEYSDSLCVA